MLKQFSTAIVLVTCNSIFAGVALQQDFNSLPIGSLTTAGQGSESNVGGWWRATSGTVDPSIQALDPLKSNERSLRLTANNRMALGSSNVSPIPHGSPFIISYSAFFRDIHDASKQIGSFYFYSDAMASLTPDTTGITMYTDTLGGLMVWDGRFNTYRRAAVSVYDCNDKWVDFKIHVKSWNDGTGYGRYDLYMNKYNKGWFIADKDNAFSSGAVSNGVNAVLFRPRSPSGEIVNSFDNISISTIALDCQDTVIFGTNPVGDLNKDCQVDFNDLKLLSENWLHTTVSGSIVWSLEWNANEMPESFNNGHSLSFDYWPAGSYTRWVQNGIYMCSQNLTDGAYVLTYNGSINAGVPLLVEARIKLEPGTNNACILVRDEKFGVVYLTLRPDNPLADSEGWYTFRFLTSAKDNHLSGAKLYIRNTTTNEWEFSGETIVRTEEAASQKYDAVALGDVGKDWEGTHYIDYLYITQDQTSILNFADTIATKSLDISKNGIINFGDFAKLANSWLQSL